MIPKQIGRYHIKSELGRGGMSTVYLAHDPHFERDVAVKLLPLELLHQSTFRRRFEREAKVVAALDHPAIVPVYDFGEEAGQPFLVMRSMTGGSLSDRLKQGALTIKEASAIISRLAPALDEVHAHAVIHRDLKPSNILFDQRNDPYISDFGTAKLIQAQTKLTDTGGAVGTPAYMSPEQIQGDEEIDGRSDIYSLGIILFEMLTGQHPYQTNTPIAVAVKHIFEPVPVIHDMVPTLPKECQEIIGRAMAKDKTERFITAQGFATALAEVSNQIETSTLQILASGEEAARPKRYALIINNNSYQDPMLSRLVKLTANVSELADVLQTSHIGNFDEVITLNNEPVHIIRREISEFFADKKSNDLLLLYYIGHAAIGTRSRLYLAATNSEHNLLRGTTIPAGFISDEMDNCLSKKQILIMDCHYSNAIENDLPSLVGQTVNSGATFARNGHERTVITATDSTQYNWHNNEVKGKASPSQFTRHFIHGLRSGAADLDQDGKVTIDELFAYIYDRVARNSVDEQIQMPRKWTSIAQKDGEKLVIAGTQNNIHHGIMANMSQQKNTRKKKAPFTFMEKTLSQHAVRWMVAGVLVLIFGLLFATSGSRASTDIEAETPNSLLVQPETETAVSDTTAIATSSPEMTPTETLSEELAIVATEDTATAVPATETATPEPTETATIAPTTTVTETAVPETSTPAEPAITTIALLSSSLFNSPDSNAQELTFVGAGEQVEILGRSQYGDWLYVRNEENITGYVYGPRFDWEGDYDTLEIVKTDSTSPQPAPVTTCSGGSCPQLTMDIYPLGSYCANDIHYRTVYMQGHGGSESYTYYWNNERLAGSQSEGFAFDVSSPDGSSVIGHGKIVSSDGQSVEQELFITDFSCN
ncbi:MAG: protein kinase [Chloroflexi bacterium]|nr:protein kinase [Chloroflexota bacterium]